MDYSGHESNDVTATRATREWIWIAINHQKMMKHSRLKGLRSALCHCSGRGSQSSERWLKWQGSLSLQTRIVSGSKAALRPWGEPMASAGRLRAITRTDIQGVWNWFVFCLFVCLFVCLMSLMSHTPLPHCNDNLMWAISMKGQHRRILYFCYLVKRGYGHTQTQ